MSEDALKLVYRPLNCSFIFSWKPEECKHENHLADALIQSEQHKKELLQLTPDADEHNTLDSATLSQGYKVSAELQINSRLFAYVCR